MHHKKLAPAGGGILWGGSLAAHLQARVASWAAAVLGAGACCAGSGLSAAAGGSRLRPLIVLPLSCTLPATAPGAAVLLGLGAAAGSLRMMMGAGL